MLTSPWRGEVDRRRRSGGGDRIVLTERLVFHPTPARWRAPTLPLQGRVVAHLQGLGIFQAQWPMGGRDDEPTRREVLAHHVGEDHLAGGIERGGRLIKQPDRATHRE